MHQNSPPGPPIKGPTPADVGNDGFSRGMPDPDSRLWALLAHGSGMFLPLIGPFIILQVKRDESDFVAYHAIQAFWWSAITVGGTTILSVLTCGTGSVVLFMFWLAQLYVGLRAREGEWYGFWGIDSLGKNGRLLG